MTPSTPFSRNPLFYLGLVAIIVIVITAQVGAFYQLQNLFGAAPSQNPLTVNTLINYGNGTSKWHNKTDVPSGWNFYQLTTTIAETEAPSSTSVSGQHYVIALDGVRSSGPSYWTLWIFCHKDAAWAASPVGADLIGLKNGNILAWHYQAPRSINAATWDPPVAGAMKAAKCTS